MTRTALAVYLNDHLAGSEAALALLAHLTRLPAAAASVPSLRLLQADITADQDALKQLMAHARAQPQWSAPMTGWIGSHVGELKLRLAARQGTALALLEGLEALALGIDGKQALWHALAAAAPELAGATGLDYARLLARAIDQRERVEALRLQAALTALGQEEQRK